MKRKAAVQGKRKEMSLLFIAEGAGGYRSKDGVNTREIFQRGNMPRACVALWIFGFMICMHTI